MKINKERAAEALRDALNRKKETPAVVHWRTRVERLVAACENSAKTHIAFLGTALLAKAVDIEVDVFSVKSTAIDPTKQAGAYSARSLAHGVLVPFATEFGVDLGVSGREPLNNQPYFRMNRIDDNTPVLGSSKEAIRVLKQVLEELNAVGKQEEAMAALQAFVQIRRKAARQEIAGGDAVRLTVDDLTRVIEEFTKTQSEGGKRSQAIAAGLLDVYAGDGRVDAGRINDPSRHYPGDVVIYSEQDLDTIEKAFEVRDKMVSVSDILIFGNRCLKHGVSEAGVVAVSPQQEPLDVDRVTKWAAERRMAITIFDSWKDLVRQTLFWSPHSGPEAAVEAAACIRRRMIEVEVSEGGLRMWDSLLRKYCSAAG